MYARALLVALALAAGCATPPTPHDTLNPTPRDGSTAHDVGSERAGFFLVAASAPLEVRAGGRTTLDVRVERRGGFDAPVLVELAGLPDGVFAQAREARVGDSITQLTIEAGDDAPAVDAAAFVVQASALGLRQTARLTIRVVP
jgi:hypothetical protein